MLRNLVCLALAGIAASAARPAFANSGECDSILPSSHIRGTPSRPVSPEDLARLRDIGPQDSGSPDERLFALSPDGTKVAFQLRQADPASNSFCLAMIVVDARPGAHALIVDKGGELIRSRINFRGKVGFQTGIPLTISPRWSADGHWIAFLKRAGPAVQVWRAQADGTGAEPLTSSATDVEDFRLSPDGKTLVFTTRPDLDREQERITREGLSGHHYDDRFAPMSSSRPFAAGPITTRYFVQEIASDEVLPADAQEKTLFKTLKDGRSDAQASAKSRDGKRAWLFAATDNPLDFSQKLIVEYQGATIACGGSACNGRMSKIWWTQDGTRLRYFKREGLGFSTTAIYEWRPGHGPARLLYATEDSFSDCEPWHDQLICVREGSTRPRQIQRLDPASGRTRTIFDPNPEMAALDLGKVERLHWKNAFGSETFADLVYPIGYRSGTSYPLIVVQYNSRGFLRGGTGDEYPIQAFAGRGFAVLSLNRPWPADLAIGTKTYVDVDKANLKDFLYRRSVQSSLEIVIKQLVDRGIVDRKRVGITGLSDGSSTAQYALLHSSLFSAAAISSCCWGPQTLALIGPQAAREFVYKGYPELSEDGSSFWRQYSLGYNAHAMSVPILVQASDDEYLDAVEGYATLREVGAPIDLFVFPDEHHIKWQPAHRLAVYKRNLAWFDFWLRDVTPVSQERKAEIEYWRSFKSRSPSHQ